MVFAFTTANSQICHDLNLEEKLLASPYQENTQGQLYLLGETHGFAENFDIQLWHIKQLHAMDSLRQVILEIPAGFEFYIEKYLKDGKIDAFKEIVFQKRQGSVFSSEEFIQFMQDFRKWNKSLPANQKVKLIPVDAESDPSTTLRAMLQMIPNGSIPKEINVTVDMMVRFRNDGVFTSEKMTILANQLEGNFLSFQGTYYELLGDYYPMYYRSLMSLINSAYRPREIAMYFNIVQYFTNAETHGNSFGQFGALHCRSGKSDKTGYFLGQMLNAEKLSPFKGAVHSGLIVYAGEESEEGLPVAPVLPFIQSQIERYCEGDNALIDLNVKKPAFEEEAKQFNFILLVDGVTDITPLN